MQNKNSSINVRKHSTNFDSIGSPHSKMVHRLSISLSKAVVFKSTISEAELSSLFKIIMKGFDKTSRVKREKIMRAFKEQHFPAGHVIIKEGEILNSAYIILEGECLMTT